jgi:hypothetical protein
LEKNVSVCDYSFSEYISTTAINTFIDVAKRICNDGSVLHKRRNNEWFSVFEYYLIDAVYDEDEYCIVVDDALIDRLSDKMLQNTNTKTKKEAIQFTGQPLEIHWWSWRELTPRPLEYHSWRRQAGRHQ